MAGILDGYQFDPQTFGGGGILAQLAAQFGLPNQLPQGFPAAKGNYQGIPPDYAPTDYTPAPPPLGAPSNVPSMQVAGANAYPAFSDNAQLPATSTPTAGTLGGGGDQNPLMGLLGGIGNLFGTSSAQAAPAPGTAQQPGIPAQAAAGPAAGPGLFGRLQAGATNLSSGGNPLAGIINAVGGLATGERTDRQGIALRNQAATEEAFKQALVTSGKFTPQQAAAFARAASFNPEIAKTLAQEFDMKPQLVDMGTDPLSGMKIQGEYDPRTHRITPLTPGVQGGTPGQEIPATQQQVLDKIRQARESGVPPEKLYDLLPESIREGTRAMVEGRSIPSNMSNRGAARDLGLRFAHAIDPSFDETLIPARVAMQKAYQGGGKNYQETLALNTVGGHLSRLADAAEGLGNTGFKPWNWLKNQTTSALSGNPALVKFRNDLVTTQNELAKAYHGGHVSDSAFAAFNNSINEAQTPAELKAAIGELAGLLGSKIQANETGYKSAMRGLPLPSEYRAINDEAKHSFDKIDKWVSGGGEGAAGQQQGAPSQLRPIDKAAIDWANANPKDPRAAAIKQRLGVQ